MRPKVIAISGRIHSGKTTLAKQLHSRFRSKLSSTSCYLRSLDSRSDDEQKWLPYDRESLQYLGSKLDDTTCGSWVTRLVCPHRHLNIIDCIRDLRQLLALRHYFDVLHIHMDTTQVEVVESQKALSHKTESASDVLSLISDMRITDDAKLPDMFSEVMDWMNCGCGVDVLFGGQFGSEGKGHIVSYLAPEYDVVVRVGGPNAGHQVRSPSGRVMTFFHIPSAAIHNPEAKLIIGPGALINPGKLVREIQTLRNITGKLPNLAIDERVMLIEDSDIEKESGSVVKSIGSTGQGVGSATARRIMRGEGVRTVRADKRLHPYITDRGAIMSYAAYGRVLIEGTQGMGLSLHHGHYPYVTSRDTSVAGLLSETGISWDRVRRVYMVCRTNPIRVQSPEGGTSGPMPNEITWEDVAKKSGVEAAKLRDRERTSTTNRLRRVQNFDMPWVQIAASMNGVTDLVLTFVDYLSEQDREVSDFDKLSSDAKYFVSRLERDTDVPVTILSTGFDHEYIIDRR